MTRRPDEAGRIASLLVEQSIGRSLEPPQIQDIRLAASGAAPDDHEIARTEGVGGHADIPEFETVVHFRSPCLFSARLVLYLHHEERMRIHEKELTHGAGERNALSGVVDAREGMMCD